jgi:hypothetical protein
LSAGSSAQRSSITRASSGNAFEITRNDRIADGILQGQRTVGVVLSLFTVALLVRRWLRASAPERRASAPVLWAGSAMFAALAFSVANDILDHPLGEGPAWTREIVFASIPIAVLAVLVQRRLARGAIAGLVVELGAASASVDFREALGRALGDPRWSWRTGFQRAPVASTQADSVQPTTGLSGRARSRAGGGADRRVDPPGALDVASSSVQSVCAGQR